MRPLLILPNFLIIILSFATPTLGEPVKLSNDCVSAKCANNQYLAGFAKVDISPDIGDLVPTMMASPQVLKKLKDPLYARALVISDGTQKVGLVAFDLLFLESAAIHEVRHYLQNNSAIDQVIITVTHTHSGIFDTDKLEQLKTRALAATQKAMGQMQAIEIGASSIAIDEAYNRRIHHNSTMKKGVEMLWVNPERKANRAVDNDLGVIHLRTLAGAPLVSIINYSAHPTVTMDLNNVVVSADYPGALSRTVSKELGGEVLFLLGAAGDVNPYDSDTKPLKLAIEKSEQLGTKLATTALAAIEKIKSYTRHGGFSYAKKNLSNPNAEISALKLAPDIAIAMFPGEYFNDFGKQLKAKSPISNTFFIGYANGSIGYVPTEVATQLGGYGADLTAPDSQVAADTGQRHIDAMIKMLIEQSKTATLKPLGSY